MIPQEKSAAVVRALREAFGVDEFEDIRPMNQGGVTAAVFRIVVRGSAYLLRVVTRPFDNSRHYAHMRLAAEAGLAPVVRYASNEDLVSITDFVEAAPFPLDEAQVRIPETLRRMHALRGFLELPKQFNTSCTFLVHEGPARDALLPKFRSEKLLGASEDAELFARLEQAVEAYRRLEPDVVSSHNDLKPENVVFDGGRVWVVDWEAAGLNDRYSDLAVFSNFVTSNEAEEGAYLRRYFGREATEYERARFYAMRQISHMFYTIAYLWVGSRAGAAAAEGEAPEFVEFHRRLWGREVDLEKPAAKMTYARVHLRRLFENVRTGRFEEALRVLAERGAHA